MSTLLFYLAVVGPVVAVGLIFMAVASVVLADIIDRGIQWIDDRHEKKR